MGLTIVLAVAAAALFGGADFMAGLASRKTPAVVVTAMTYAAGLLVVGGWALAGPPMVVTGADTVWIAVSAVTGVLGVVTLYAAFGTGRLSIVAPLTAGLAAAGPAAFDIARGARLTWTAGAGMVLAVAAIVVVSMGHPDEGGTDSRVHALIYAVVSGSAFAVSISGLSMIGHAAGMAPLLAQRLLGIVALTPIAALLLMRREPGRTPLPARRVVATAIVAGLVDSVATITFLAAIRSGPLALAAVLGGLYPVGTILLAHFFLGERMTAKERIGVGMALAAVVLTALP